LQLRNKLLSIDGESAQRSYEGNIVMNKFVKSISAAIIAGDDGFAENLAEA